MKKFISIASEKIMVTYKKIQEYVKETYGFVTKSCWISHMKEVLGIESKVVANRIDINKRTYPCPEDKQRYIEDVFRHLDIIG